VQFSETVSTVGADVGFCVGNKRVLDVGAASGASVGTVGNVSVGENVGMLLYVGGGVGTSVGGGVYRMSTKKPGLKASESSPYTDLHWVNKRLQ